MPCSQTQISPPSRTGRTTGTVSDFSRFQRFRPLATPQVIPPPPTHLQIHANTYTSNFIVEGERSVSSEPCMHPSSAYPALIRLEVRAPGRENDHCIAGDERILLGALVGDLCVASRRGGSFGRLWARGRGPLGRGAGTGCGVRIHSFCIRFNVNHAMF